MELYLLIGLVGLIGIVSPIISSIKLLLIVIVVFWLLMLSGLIKGFSFKNKKIDKNLV